MQNYDVFSGILLSQSKLFASCSFDFKDHQVLRGWYEALEDISEKELHDTLKELLDELTFFPSVAEIRNKVKPKADIQTEVYQIFDRIIRSIRLLGREREKEIPAFVGPIGWKSILSLGGYRRLTDFKDELSTDYLILQNQLKEFIKSHLITAKNSNQETFISLPEKPNEPLQKALESISSFGSFVIETNNSEKKEQKLGSLIDELKGGLT